MLHRIAIILSLVLAIAPLARSQEPIIKVQVSADEIYLGDALQLFIEVEVTGTPVDVTTPHFDPTSMIRIEGPSISSARQESTSFVNGRSSRVSYHTTVFEFRVTPERIGDVTIPSSTIFIDGQSYRTNPIEIRVIEAPEVDFATLELLADSTTAYLGQPIRVRLRSTSNRIYTRGQLLTPPLPEGLRLVPVNPDANLLGGRVSSLPIFDTTVQTAISVNEATRSITFEAAFDLIPERVGSFTIEPLSFQMTVREGRQEARYSAHSEPLELAVLPLPTTGRPETFAGHVGDYQLVASASHAEARLGDPITLQLTVINSHPGDNIDPPPLEDQARLLEAFKPSPEGWSRVGTSRNGHVFSTVLRPRIAGIEEIPSIELPYFDPSDGVYKVARSKPLPLKVTAAREITAADAVGQSGLPVTRETLTPGTSGVRANRLSGNRLRTDGFDLEATMRSPGMLAVLIAPPALWLAMTGGTLLVRRRDPQAYRRRTALARALRTIRRSGGDRARCASALRAYVADTLGMPLASVTSADLARCAGDNAHEAAHLLRSTIGDLEAATYGGRQLSPADEATLVDSLRTLNRTRSEAR